MPLDRDEIPTIRKSLTFYRVMAWVVGIQLVVLICVGVPLKYFGGNDAVVVTLGPLHGWLYMVLLISAYLLGRRVDWPWMRLILIALAGTVPFLSFVAEHYATKDVRRRIALAEAGAPQPAVDQPTMGD
ncbi:DUF3817 domain-containing protein [Nigerium massiliense]|uniref:DUF3817 domain-containing protein n=1 Tax=Nigerium massiliense TaxID=1522317 RepID=UPI000694925C|nr:DUF3817 domain-containing protein [Nigerium massiliense]